ncbi:MAG: tRNA (adenine-N1)-methyltransferase [Ilumatobacteraceae bacterium]
MSARRAFAAGDTVMLIDGRDRRYLVTLAEDGEFHSHRGVLPHASIIGAPEGARLASSLGTRYVAVRPSLEDVVLHMPRGAQVIYPKDLGAMTMLADVAPGQRVMETGVGSGALSIALLRLGADVTGIELREDFAARATANVRAHAGGDLAARWRVRLGDAYEPIDVPAEGPWDRVLLDIPEPWRVSVQVPRILRAGGTMVAYTPSIVQAMQVRETMGRGWVDVRTLEVLHRTWHVEGKAVRPDHRMVAHTAFLTAGRWIGLGLDEDALPGALLGGLDDRIEE